MVWIKNGKSIIGMTWNLHSPISHYLDSSMWVEVDVLDLNVKGLKCNKGKCKGGMEEEECGGEGEGKVDVEGGFGEEEGVSAEKVDKGGVME
ncbi:hypothetical protein VNO80_25080 [Phaseolus coccineus]|uniref:Uncharacterized protein n=1 Tax=Phaseolus coccineus TaxID=3886 RepID=A0AAN9QNM3_PHACN